MSQPLTLLVLLAFLVVSCTASIAIEERHGLNGPTDHLEQVQ